MQSRNEKQAGRVRVPPSAHTQSLETTVFQGFFLFRSTRFSTRFGLKTRKTAPFGAAFQPSPFRILAHVIASCFRFLSDSEFTTIDPKAIST
jgi:hypothetical protein